MWNSILVIGGWVLGWIAFGRPRPLGAAQVPPAAGARGIDTSRPTVSIVVPARNEAGPLPLLLADLRRSAPPGSQVIVVDDDSGDDTAAIASSFDAVTVIDAGDRPPGWLGKPWACHVGASRAASDVICFLDADVRLESGAIESVVDEARESGGLVSVAPSQEIERPYESASALFAVVAAMGSALGSPRPTGAFGPVLATTTDAYHRAGGHTAVRADLLDDVVLARRYREAGLPVRVYTGGGRLRYRMYAGGVRPLVEGWTKNIALGASSTPAVRTAAIVAWLGAMGTAVGLLWSSLLGDVPVLLGGSAYLAFVLQLRLMLSRLGRFPLTAAVLYPLLMAVFFAVFARSMWLTHVRHEVTWRGRPIALGQGGGSA